MVKATGAVEMYSEEDVLPDRSHGPQLPVTCTYHHHHNIVDVSPNLIVVSGVCIHSPHRVRSAPAGYENLSPAKRRDNEKLWAAVGFKG